MAINGYLAKSSVVAALGGLLFGFDTAVISGATGALRAQFSLNDDTLGITVAAALVGTILGAMFGGIPGDRYGRRASLRITAILYLISAIGCAFAFDWYSFVFARFVGGLGIGASSVLGPMYIAEIAPARLRGRLVGFFQFNIVFGILAAYLSNYLVGTMSLGDAEWRWKLGIPAIPAALFLLMLFTIPESPRWLAKRGRVKEAEDVLRATGDENYRADLNEIMTSVDEHVASASEPFFRRKYRVPIFLAITIGMFNQLSGINAILYYLNDIFAKAGFTKVSGDLQAVAVGATNLLFTMIAMTQIDRLGRKTLLLIGAVGTAVALAGVAAIFFAGTHQELLVWCLVAFIAFFAFSQGAVIWVYLSEVFPTRVRAKGQSLGSFTHWIMNALISAIFPRLAASSGGAPFVFFAAMMVLQFFVVLAVYPETKGYSLEEMQKKLGDRLMIAGVDIGGTKVAAALVTADGVIAHKVRVPMVSTGDAATGFAAVREAIGAILAAHPEGVTGIGICSPGPLDPVTGVVLNPPNLPCWRNFPLAAEVEKAFGVPARVDNDGNAAGLAEALWGAGVGYRNVFYATLGTGIGAGIIFDRKIYHGRTGSAAEGGHVSIDYRGPVCGCGKRGCIEALASGTQIAWRAREKLAAGAGSRILAHSGGIEQVLAEHVGAAFREGDAVAREVLTETAFLLTVWLGNIVDLLEPDVIVVGGGVAELMSSFFADMSANLPRWCLNQRANEIPLVLARYGADAGIVGAAALCR